MSPSRAVIFGALSVAVFGGRSVGQSTYDGCINAQGQPVISIATLDLQDVAIARRAPNGVPAIYYNPRVLSNLSRPSRLFWYGHECGHHALGHEFRGHPLTHEQEADCFGIVAIVEQGVIRETDVRIVQNELSRAGPGDWSHLPGPQRSINLSRCLQEAGIGTVDRPAKPRGRSSCEYARDGMCDEPDICDRGTDDDDCRDTDTSSQDTAEPLIGPPIASYCVTQWGSCPMRIALPVGSYCTCYMPTGNYPGVAR